MDTIAGQKASSLSTRGVHMRFAKSRKYAEEARDRARAHARRTTDARWFMRLFDKIFDDLNDHEPRVVEGRRMQLSAVEEAARIEAYAAARACSSYQHRQACGCTACDLRRRRKGTRLT
jgi:hypothetical protein